MGRVFQTKNCRIGVPIPFFGRLGRKSAGRRWTSCGNSSNPGASGVRQCQALSWSDNWHAERQVPWLAFWVMSALPAANWHTALVGVQWAGAYGF
jgi:hypothetical protein